MAAPTITAIGTPGGLMLEDGHSTVIVFALNPALQLEEKTLQPPGLDGGDAIETTTMRNTRWRTMASRHLITLTEGKVTVAYDPELFDAILSMINVVDSITVHFPNGDAYAFWGFLQKFEPGELQEGEQPEADITFVPVNRDPSTGDEEDPVLVLA